jgi:hypothetical protein
MVPEAAFALLLLGTACWILLPLIPAVRELWRPTDAMALTQVGHDAGDLSVFAEGFRSYLARETLPEGAGNGGTLGQLRDGTPLVELNGQPDLLQRVATPDGTIGRMVLTTGPIIFPGRETFLYEVYARHRFMGGPDAAYRALLAEQDAELGVRSHVVRWVHAEGDLVLGEGTELEGRASSSGTMWLGADVRFTRLRAVRVVAGRDERPAPAVPPPAVTSSMRLPRSARRLRGFTRVEGDLTVPPDATLVGTFVVFGHVTLGHGARVAGSIKAHGNCEVGVRAVVDGALVACGSIRLGERARVCAPVIAEGDAIIGVDAVIGRPDSPSSLTAEHITLGLGAQVFGAVGARVGGIVVR